MVVGAKVSPEISPHITCRAAVDRCSRPVRDVVHVHEEQDVPILRNRPILRITRDRTVPVSANARHFPLTRDGLGARSEPVYATRVFLASVRPVDKAGAKHGEQCFGPLPAAAALASVNAPGKTHHRLSARQNAPEPVSPSLRRYCSAFHPRRDRSPVVKQAQSPAQGLVLNAANCWCDIWIRGAQDSKSAGVTLVGRRSPRRGTAAHSSYQHMERKKAKVRNQCQ